MTDKAILLTRHAAQRIVESQIQLVEQAARSPERRQPDRMDHAVERRFARIAEAGARWLRVSVVEAEDAIRVVSVHFGRGATRDARQHL